MQSVAEAPRPLLPVLHVIVGDGRPRVLRFAPAHLQTVGRLSGNGRRFRHFRRFPLVGHPDREGLLRRQFSGSRPAGHFHRHHVRVVSGLVQRISAGCVCRGFVVRRLPEAQLSSVGGNRELKPVDPAHDRPARDLVPRVAVPGRQPPRHHLVLGDVERSGTRDLRSRVERPRGVGHRPVDQPPCLVAHFILDWVRPHLRRNRVAHPDPRIPVLDCRIQEQRHHATAYRDSRDASPRPVHLHREVPRRRPRPSIERFPVGQRQRGSLHRRAHKRRPHPVDLVPRLRGQGFMAQLGCILRLVFEGPSVQGDAARLDAHSV